MNSGNICPVGINRRNALKYAAVAGIAVALTPFSHIESAIADESSPSRVMSRYVDLVYTYHEKHWGKGMGDSFVEHYDITYRTYYIPNGYRLRSTKKMLESDTAAYTLFYCINDWEIY